MSGMFARRRPARARLETRPRQTQCFAHPEGTDVPSGHNLFAVKVSVCVGSVRPRDAGWDDQVDGRQTFADWELVIVGQGADPALRAVGEAAAREDGASITFTRTSAGFLAHAIWP